MRVRDRNVLKLEYRRPLTPLYPRYKLGDNSPGYVFGLGGGYMFPQEQHDDDKFINIEDHVRSLLPFVTDKQWFDEDDSTDNAKRIKKRGQKTPIDYPLLIEQLTIFNDEERDKILNPVLETMRKFKKLKRTIPHKSGYVFTNNIELKFGREENDSDKVQNAGDFFSQREQSKEI